MNDLTKIFLHTFLCENCWILNIFKCEHIFKVGKGYLKSKRFHSIYIDDFGVSGQIMGGCNNLLYRLGNLVP